MLYHHASLVETHPLIRFGLIICCVLSINIERPPTKTQIERASNSSTSRYGECPERKGWCQPSPTQRTPPVRGLHWDLPRAPRSRVGPKINLQKQGFKQKHSPSINSLWTFRRKSPDADIRNQRPTLHSPTRGQTAPATRRNRPATMAQSTGFGPKKAYLILYNSASAIAWATILGRVVLVTWWKGAPFVPLVVDNFARVTQTFAVMEILHALTGAFPFPIPGSQSPYALPSLCISMGGDRVNADGSCVFGGCAGVVPAPVFTTAMQVASRLFLMWAICWPFPQLNTSVFYTSMLCAWSLTEVMRYTFFALKQVEAVPGWLNWLRYSAFLVLYPVGISSELAMSLQALLGPASSLAPWYPYAILAVMLTYIPGKCALPVCEADWRESVANMDGLGSFILYTHMLKQRRRYLGAGKAAEQKKTQ